ncbi:MAG: DNA/RNA non-specific endonuclease [Phyllobacteriaceae bacterium]|nr:DNA/RNA non-specific endonuclease [Phyllobacteriaceae bacterium]
MAKLRKSDSGERRRDISVLENAVGLAQRLQTERNWLSDSVALGVNRERDDKRYAIRKTLIGNDSSDPNGFERVIGESDLLSINFFDKGKAAAAAVCRIVVPEPGGEWYGTGFMVGPRLLLTNHHVLGSAAEADQATAEFGYEHDADAALRQPQRYKLAPSEIFFTDSGLDVTFVAVVPLSDNSVPIERYGRLPLIPLSGKALHGEHVTIIQHPGGKPKQIAIRASQIIEFKKDARIPGLDTERFIHYTTDTEPGSSGAPVLNDQWQVVALHHKAVPAPPPEIDDSGKKPAKRAAKPPAEELAEEEPVWIANEGVRVSAIYRLLHSRRLTDANALAAVERIERAFGMPSTNPAPFGNQQDQATEADGKALSESSWTGAAFGYDPDFLTTALPLKTVLARNTKKAAPLKDGVSIVLDYLHFSSVIHRERKFAMITAVNIHGEKLGHPGKRAGVWRRDIRIDDEFQPAGNFYETRLAADPVQFSRGHLVRRVDPCWGTEEEVKLAEKHTFHYTNAAPQVQRYNDVDWGNLEDYLLDKAQTKEKRLTVFTGPMFRSSDPEYGHEREGGPWQIPVSFWKIAVLQKTDETIAAAGFVVGQVEFLRPLYGSRVFTALTPTPTPKSVAPHPVPIRSIEDQTGFNFSVLRAFDAVGGLEATRQVRIVAKPDDIVI